MLMSLVSFWFGKLYVESGSIELLKGKVRLFFVLRVRSKEVVIVVWVMNSLC